MLRASMLRQKSGMHVALLGSVSVVLSMCIDIGRAQEAQAEWQNISG